MNVKLKEKQDFKKQYFAYQCQINFANFQSLHVFTKHLTFIAHINISSYEKISC